MKEFFQHLWNYRIEQLHFALHYWYIYILFIVILSTWLYLLQRR